MIRFNLPSSLYSLFMLDNWWIYFPTLFEKWASFIISTLRILLSISMQSFLQQSGFLLPSFWINSNITSSIWNIKFMVFFHRKSIKSIKKQRTDIKISWNRCREKSNFKKKLCNTLKKLNENIHKMINNLKSMKISLQYSIRKIWFHFIWFPRISSIQNTNIETVHVRMPDKIIWQFNIFDILMNFFFGCFFNPITFLIEICVLKIPEFSES